MKLQMNDDELYVRWQDSLASDEPSSLATWLEQYPEHRESLVLWASAEPLFAASDRVSLPPDAETRTAAAGMQALAEVRAQYTTARAPAISSLVKSAQAAGLDAASLAARLDLSELLLLKLERRLVQAASIPHALAERLADCLQSTTDQVRAYLAQPPALARAAMYKADRAPQARQQEFVAAVRSCPEMTDTQKAAWLALAGEETHPDA